MKTHIETTKTGIIVAMFLLLGSTIWIGCESKKVDQDSSDAAVTNLVAAEPLALESEAVELLRRGLDFLANQEMFSVQTQGTYEDVLNEIYRVDYETSASLTVKRPNKLRIERHGLEMNQNFYYDGNELTLNNPYDNVYATVPAPGNIEDMFHVARDTFGISGPASDLIYNNSFSLLIQDVNAATVIGKEMIGDVMCDHLLFSRPDVTFQIWISESKPYLPYKYVVTDTSTPQLLSFATVMKNWNIAPKISEAMFKFTPPEGSKNILLLRTDQSTEK